MIVTEEEAKTKLCQERFGPTQQAVVPLYSTEHNNPYGHSWSQPPFTMAPAHCIGSACMAWRWKRENLYKQIDERDKLPKDHANYADWILLEGAGDHSTTFGYCGKAGKP